MRKYSNYFLFMLLFSNVQLFGQSGDLVGYAFLDKGDIDYISRPVGELYLSFRDYSIDDFVIMDGLKFTMSKTHRNEIRIHNNDNLTLKRMNAKSKNKRGFIGLYRVGNSVFYAPRPENKKNYRLSRNEKDSSSFKLKAITGTQIKNNRAFFLKTINSEGVRIKVVDFLGLAYDSKNIESAVLFQKHGGEIDTLDVIEKPEGLSNVLQPYSSWSYDITEGANGRFFVVQNFTNGVIKVIDREGKVENAISSQKRIEELELKVAKQFFLGRYNFYSKVFTDYKNGKTYLYLGGLDVNKKAQGLMFQYNEEDKVWDLLDMDYEENPNVFIDVCEIEDGFVYFLIRNEEGNRDVYKRKLFE